MALIIIVVTVIVLVILISVFTSFNQSRQIKNEESIEDLQKEWQRKWREALGEPTDSMPDIGDDYTLHFDIWNLGDEKLKQCFSIFPKGDLLFKRVNEVRKTHPTTTDIDEQSLLNSLEQLNRNIELVLHEFGDSALIELNAQKSKVGKRSMYRGDETLRREVLKNSDSPTVHLDDELCEIIEKYCGKQGAEAFFFLSEPLYQLSGCYYTVSHWIAWAMVEKEFDVDPYQPAFELYKVKAQAGWSDEEQFVFIQS